MTRGEILARLLARAEAQGFALARLDEATDPTAATDGRDADLLAGWHRWPDWTALIARSLDGTGWRIVTAIPRGAVLTLYLARDDGTEFLAIDLHRAATARLVPFIDATALLDRALVAQGVRRLHPGQATAVRELQHRLIHGRPRRPGTVIAADLLAEAGGTAWPRAALRALARRPRLVLRVAAARLADGLAAWCRPPGQMWVVSGPDGAGKSTLIAALAEWLPGRLGPAVRLFHTRPFLLPRLAGLRGGDAGAQAGQAPAAGRLASVLRLGIAWADWHVGHWLLVRPHLVRGRTVIYDRHAPDYRVAPVRRGIDLPQAMVDLVARHVPGGTGRIVLVAEPALLVARKGELDLAEARRQVAAYRALAADDPAALLLDGGAAAPDGLMGRAVAWMIALAGRRCAS